MEISGRISIDLSPEEVDRVFFRKLEDLISGRWVDKDGKVFEEGYTSHRFDVDITDKTPPEEFLVLSAALELQKALRGFEEYRKILRFMATRPCSRCGHGRASHIGSRDECYHKDNHQFRCLCSEYQELKEYNR